MAEDSIKPKLSQIRRELGTSSPFSHQAINNPSPARRKISLM